MSEKLARCPPAVTGLGETGCHTLRAWFCLSVSSPKPAVPAAIYHDRALGMLVTMIWEALQYQAEQQERCGRLRLLRE